MKIDIESSTIYADPIMDGTRIRVVISLSEPRTGNGGNLTILVEPSDSIAEIKKRAIAELKRFASGITAEIA
jgi:hypothetical protein